MVINPPAIHDHIEAPPGFEGFAPREACPEIPPPPPPPSRAACVRHDLVGFADMLARRTLARAVRAAATVDEWRDVAFDFEGASRTARSCDERWRGARAAARAADLMAVGCADEAAAALADFYGLTLDTWHWSTCEDIAKGGAR